MNADQKNAVLEAENQRLRDRIWQLEQVLRFDMALPSWLGLTKHEALIVSALVAREGGCSKEALLTALYSDRADEEPNIKIIDVFICKTRKKLAAFGIEIETMWGRGYRFDTANRQKLNNMIAGATP